MKLPKMGESLNIERKHKLNVDEEFRKRGNEAHRYSCFMQFIAVEFVKDLKIFSITRSCSDLGKCLPFPGVYLIYYDGTTSLYENQIRPDREKPIYIGKSEISILQRLKDHQGKVTNAKDLEETDFFVRFMILGPNERRYAPAIEGVLQDYYSPLWNDKEVKFSFGNANNETSNWYQYHVAENEDKRKEMIESVRGYKSRTLAKLNLPTPL